ncbi:hypothetical protein D5086_000902 [Populus alba]|uniref:Uncharacterized protein n=1 Tax=Populus alba TaxID=43335 RepID=A0ACC4CYG0_POPAL
MLSVDSPLLLRSVAAWGSFHVMVVAIDGPVATHLADGMTGTEEEGHALRVADGEMITVIHIRDAGIALCLLTAATTDRTSYLIASINPLCPWFLKLDLDSHGSKL